MIATLQLTSISDLGEDRLRNSEGGLEQESDGRVEID